MTYKSSLLKEKLIDIIKKSRLINEKQLEQALAYQKEHGGNLGNILLEQGLIKEKELVFLLSSSLNLPVLNLSRFKVDPDVIKIIPSKVAKQYHLIPVSKMGNSLTVCMSDPLNILAIDDIKALTHYEIDTIISTDKEIQEAIHTYYEADAADLSMVLEDMRKEKEESLEEEFEVTPVGEETIDIEDMAAQSNIPPVVKVVNLMLTEAVEKRVSDIHVEPEESEVRVRYRIDGALREAFTIPKDNQNAVLSRLKIMSGLNITEWRLPQDGRFKIKVHDKEVDFRVSILPVTHGGKVVMRALDKASLSVGLKHLGFEDENLEKLNIALAKPYGMILVTGPTGSGKSTTLYSIVTKLNVPEKNIVTIEDPVEYKIEGISQIQVNEEIKLTFANGLRAILRQTPDIVLIGEIRDFDTADIGVKASLTGQLLLSTLHTNDAPSAVTRLIDMGLEPYLVASSLICIIAQRLCRKICPNCKEKAVVSQAVLDRLGLKLPKGAVFYKGKGCSKCNGSGYHGRMGVLEVLLIDDGIRELITDKVSSDKLREYAISKGMTTLRDNAFAKCLKGLTTIEEVLRVTTEE
ncbi:MAG: ATPase, T2SS/T4P/T4SS family [Candidatus Omnitrophota bacterium]